MKTMTNRRYLLIAIMLLAGYASTAQKATVTYKAISPPSADLLSKNLSSASADFVCVR